MAERSEDRPGRLPYSKTKVKNVSQRGIKVSATIF